MATIFDVGKLAGVSRSTVSRVLNNKSDVDPETAKLVWEAVRKLNYHPNASARALARQKTDTIGVMLAHVSDPYYEKIIKGIETILAARNMSVIFFNSYDHLAEHKKIINAALKSSQIDGLIVVGSHSGDSEILLEMMQQIPMAFIEREFNDLQVTCICSDNKQGVFLAIQHLVELKHVRIGCITGDLQYQTAIERFEGYKEALKHFKLPFDPDLVYYGNFQHSGGYNGLKKLCSQRKKPTAIFACNDMMAIGALQAANDFGLVVPKDIAIIGYDDTYLAPMVYPQLTTVRQPLFEMGSAAVQGLLNQLNAKDSQPLKKKFPVELIIRRSCGFRSLSL
ncbi:MAG TPA: LacI family DNA-binding transcriptional regulator [Bacillota bacterium]|nr:LacI family DNA-binding transcriptional regulator [Bacillota bacterium]HOL09267.1 LacI family DNA-binding transcriptional regulator [Bacillota bacterium]HPO96930.1 LacI family DNA-binding transcriptional regulator [Bacillota bacterium]